MSALGQKRTLLVLTGFAKSLSIFSSVTHEVEYVNATPPMGKIRSEMRSGPPIVSAFIYTTTPASIPGVVSCGLLGNEVCRSKQGKGNCPGWGVGCQPVRIVPSRIFPLATDIVSAGLRTAS